MDCGQAHLILEEDFLPEMVSADSVKDPGQINNGPKTFFLLVLSSVVTCRDFSRLVESNENFNCEEFWIERDILTTALL